MARMGSVVRTVSGEALLTGLGSGDPDAAAGFVDRFQRRVYGMTLSILRDRQAAEEASQEAFVRAWRHAAAYDPRRGTVAAWLLTIARNVAVNMLQSHPVYQVDPEALLGLQDTRPSPDADGELAPVSHPLREALMRLPGEQRRALMLAVFYGYTAREVSELDKTPIGTVKTRIRTALMRLRSQLGYAMNDDVGCEQVRALAADLAIGIADGQEHDAALRHAATCAECRLLVSELSSVADDLLLLAPSHEPPPGFASRTLARMTPSSPQPRPEPSAACSDTKVSPPGCSPP